MERQRNLCKWLSQNPLRRRSGIGSYQTSSIETETEAIEYGGHNGIGIHTEEEINKFYNRLENTNSHSKSRKI